MENNQKPLIHGKIISVMKEITAIGKGNRNVEQNFNFRGIDDMYNAVHPLFQKHGIFIIPTMSNHVTVERLSNKGSKFLHTHLDATFAFYAEDGSCVTSQMKGEAMDYGDKGTNKAMSAALKYAIMQMFLIPTQELKQLDADKHSPTIGKEKLEDQQTLVQEAPNPNAMTEADEKQIKEDLLLYETEKEILDYASGWEKYKKNLVFAGICHDRISQLKPENKMTPAQRKAWRKPHKK